MARKLRIQFPGATYHLAIRGVAGLPIFRDDHDRRRFLWLLADVIHRRGWVCHAYCLMRTHYHLLVRTPDADVALGMKRLNGAYAQGFNRRHGCFGHAFAHRYVSVLVETEPHLLELSRYVVLNPVRAGACERPEQWPWSSYRAAIGLDPCPPWLNARWLVSLFGPDPAVARRRYAAFVSAGRADDRVTHP